MPVDAQAGPLAYDPPSSDKGDIYFTPCVFSEPRRLNDLALPSRLLYADLDEVDPRTITPRPTVAWQSSPARFQAIWVLTKRLPPELFSQLNQALTYSTGADKGGWHQSKVLRLPGTRNYKYRGRPSVKLMWFTKQRYAPQSLADALKGSAPLSTPSSPPAPRRMSETASPAALLRQHPPSTRIRRLLRVKRAVGAEDRSARLWEIENGLLKAGMSPEQVLQVVKACAYNKYKGQRREDRILWQEINKAAELQKKESAPAGTFHPGTEGRSPKSRRSGKTTAVTKRSPATRQGSKSGDEYVVTGPNGETKQPSTALKPVKLKRFLASTVPEPSWLVESIWGRSAQGIWAGEFKAYKSTLLLDLAVSVSSGSPFLGQFDVKRQGPVIFIQEENSPGFMHDRLHRIVQAKGLGNQFSENGTKSTIKFGKDLELYLESLTGFRLNNEQHLTALDGWCHFNKPALIILDPLYRMAPEFDEKRSEEMAPLLANLSKISNRHDCALILAHHYNQPTADNKGLRSGYRISGTSVFARWFESSVYVERKGEEGDYTVKFHNEHREHAAGSSQNVTVDLDPLDPDTYAIHLTQEDAEVIRKERKISDRGRVSGPEAKAERLREIARYINKLDKPTTMIKIRNDLGFTRTDSVKKVIRASRREFDIETRTVKGKPTRYVIPVKRREDA